MRKQQSPHFHALPSSSSASSSVTRRAQQIALSQGHRQPVADGVPTASATFSSASSTHDHSASQESIHSVDLLEGGVPRSSKTVALTISTGSSGESEGADLTDLSTHSNATSAPTSARPTDSTPLDLSEPALSHDHAHATIPPFDCATPSPSPSFLVDLAAAAAAMGRVPAAEWTHRTTNHQASTLAMLPPALRAARHRMRPKHDRAEEKSKRRKDDALRAANSDGRTPNDVGSVTTETASLADSTASATTSAMASVGDEPTLSSTGKGISARDPIPSTNPTPLNRADALAAVELRSKLMDPSHQKVFNVPDPHKGLDVSEESVEKVIVAGGGAASALRQVVQMEVHQVKFDHPDQLAQAVHVLSLPLTLIDFDADADEVFITECPSSSGAESAGGSKVKVNDSLPRRMALRMPRDARDYVVQRSQVRNLLTTVMLMHSDEHHDAAEDEIKVGPATPSSRRSKSKPRSMRQQQAHAVRTLQQVDMDSESESEMDMVEVDEDQANGSTYGHGHGHGHGHRKANRQSRSIKVVELTDEEGEEEEEMDMGLEVEESLIHSIQSSRESHVAKQLLDRLTSASHRPLFTTAALTYSTSDAADDEHQVQHVAKVLNHAFPTAEAMSSALRHVVRMQLEEELQFEDVEQMVQAVQILQRNEGIGLGLNLTFQNEDEALMDAEVDIQQGPPTRSGSRAAAQRTMSQHTVSSKAGAQMVQMLPLNYEEMTGLDEEEKTSSAMASPRHAGQSKGHQIHRSHQSLRRAAAARTIQLVREEVSELGLPQLVSEYVLKHSQVQLEMARIESATAASSNAHGHARASKSYKIAHVQHHQALDMDASMSFEEVYVDGGGGATSPRPSGGGHRSRAQHQHAQPKSIHLQHTNLDGEEEEMMVVEEVMQSEDAMRTFNHAPGTSFNALNDGKLSSQLAREQLVAKLCAVPNPLFPTPDNRPAFTKEQVESLLDAADGSNDGGTGPTSDGAVEAVNALRHILAFESEKIQFKDGPQVVAALRTLALPLKMETVDLEAVQVEARKQDLPVKAQQYVMKHTIVQLEMAKVEQVYPAAEEGELDEERRAIQRKRHHAKHAKTIIRKQIEPLSPSSATSMEVHLEEMDVYEEGTVAAAVAVLEDNPAAFIKKSTTTTPKAAAAHPSRHKRTSSKAQPLSLRRQASVEAEMTEEEQERARVEAAAAAAAKEREASDAHLRQALKKRLSVAAPLFSSDHPMVWGDADIDALIRLGKTYPTHPKHPARRAAAD